MISQTSHGRTAIFDDEAKLNTVLSSFAQPVRAHPFFQIVLDFFAFSSGPNPCHIGMYDGSGNGYKHLLFL